MKLAPMTLIVTVGYVILYTGYTFAAKTMPGRICYVVASVLGTIIGSTLGNRWFS